MNGFLAELAKFWSSWISTKVLKCKNVFFSISHFEVVFGLEC